MGLFSEKKTDIELLILRKKVPGVFFFWYTALPSFQCLTDGKVSTGFSQF